MKALILRVAYGVVALALITGLIVLVWNTRTTLPAGLDAITNFALTLAKLVGALAVVFLGPIVLYRLARQVLRPPQLVVDPFRNASGAAELDGALVGLSQQAREQLLAQLRAVDRQITTRIKGVGPDSYHPPDTAPLPEGTPDGTLDRLVGSIKEYAPKEITPAVQLLGLALPPRGTRVSGTLQRCGDEPGKLGITLELADIASQRAFHLWTHWELPVAPASASAPIAAAAQLSSADTLCALAAAYEVRGALEQAKSSYETALQQKPDLVVARDGLLRVLGMQWTLSERYSNLLCPSMRRLALELAKREMQKRVCRLCGKAKRIRYEARTLNFFGAMYEASYQSFGGEFARLAIADFQRAIDLDPEWYQPYENLADVYTFMAQSETDLRTSLQQLHSALLQYVVALARAKKAAEGQETLNRIMVGMATAQLLTGTAALVEKARSSILALTQTFPLGNQMDSRYLYNLASWYGFANQSQPPEPGARDAARRILGFSLGREHDPDVWSYAEWDPAFKGTCDGLDVLEFTIAEEMQRRLSAGEMSLSLLPEDKFTLVMEAIFKQAEWL